MDKTIQGVYYDVLRINSVDTKEGVITYLSDYLKDRGCVNDKYVDATINREHIYPTGLPTKPIGIAVPHSERENVIKPAVIMGILDNPVEFMKMEDSSSSMEAGIVFLLALKGEDSHLNYLKNIVNYCKNQQNIKKLYYSNTHDEAFNIFMSDILRIG